MRAGDTIAHFEILAPLGAGGMGQVWRARDLKLKREVALKLLPERLAADRPAMARFRREAELMASVEHPNIASIHSIEEAAVDGRTAQVLVLELVQGRTLAERLKEGDLPVANALAVGAQAARALQAAHERGVVHRDLKPANVMLGPRGRVKVLDFGIAKATETGERKDPGDAPTSIEATAAGMLVGTAPYMSPEQVRGKNVDARSDVWALGCLLFEMLTGERAFRGETPGDVLAAVLADEPRWERLPTALPPAVARMLRGCLQKDASARTWSASEVRRVLETAAEGRAAPMLGRRGRRMLAGIAATAVLAVALVWLVQGGAGVGDGESSFLMEELTSVVALPPTLEGAADELFRGTHQALTNHLAGLPGVVVKEPPSEVEVERLGGDLRRVADEYRVDALLRSIASARPDGTVLTVRVVDPRNGALLWGRDFRSAGSGPEVVIERAAVGLRSALRPTAAAWAAEAAGSAHPRAQAELNLGRAYARSYNNTHDDDYYQRARRALQSALDLDPGLASAAAELANLAQYRWEAGDASAVDELGQWAELAVDLGPDSAEAWAAKSIWDLHRTGSPLAAIPAALRAGALGPSVAQAQFALGFWTASASVDLGVLAIERAAELDPLHLYIRATLASMRLGQGSLPVEDYLRHARYPYAMQPDNAVFAASLGMALGRIGDEDGVAETLAAVRANASRFEPTMVQGIETLHALRSATLAERPLEISAEVDRIVRMAPELTVFMGMDVLLEATTLLARSGYAAEAERLLSLPLENEQLLMPWDIYAHRPDFAALRGTEAMDGVLAAARTRLDAAMQMIGEAYDRGELVDYLVEPYLALREELGAGGGEVAN